MERQGQIRPGMAPEISAVMHCSADIPVRIGGFLLVLRINDGGITADEGPDRIGDRPRELAIAKPLHRLVPNRLRDSFGPDFQALPHGQGCQRFQRFAVVNVDFYVHR